MMLMAGRGLITGPHPVRVALRPSAARVLPIMQRRLVGAVAGAAAATGAAAPAAGSRFKLRKRPPVASHRTWLNATPVQVSPEYVKGRRRRPLVGDPGDPHTAYTRAVWLQIEPCTAAQQSSDWTGAIAASGGLFDEELLAPKFSPTQQIATCKACRQYLSAINDSDRRDRTDPWVGGSVFERSPKYDTGKGRYSGEAWFKNELFTRHESRFDHHACMVMAVAKGDFPALQRADDASNGTGGGSGGGSADGGGGGGGGDGGANVDTLSSPGVNTQTIPIPSTTLALGRSHTQIAPPNAPPALLDISELEKRHEWALIFYVFDKALAAEPVRGLTRQAALARRLDVPGFAENDSSTYETKDAAEDILAQISKQFSEDQLKRLAQSPFFSVTADGSTDIGKLHTLTIDVRYLHPKSCEVTTEFLELVVCDGNAERITKAIMKALFKSVKEHGTWAEFHNKLIGASFDGASNMMGRPLFYSSTAVL